MKKIFENFANLFPLDHIINFFFDHPVYFPLIINQRTWKLQMKKPQQQQENLQTENLINPRKNIHIDLTNLQIRIMNILMLLLRQIKGIQMKINSTF